MDEMMVIGCHAKPTIHSPFTNHQKSLRQAIQSIQPTDINTNLEPALDLAYAVAQTKPSAEIVIFSDFQVVSEDMLTQLQNPGEKIHSIQFRLVRRVTMLASLNFAYGRVLSMRSITKRC